MSNNVEEMSGATGDGTVPEQPLLFLKPNTSVVGPGDAIVRPNVSDRVEFEGELAVIIGAVAKICFYSRANEVIFGYTCANDVSARDIQIVERYVGASKKVLTRFVRSVTAYKNAKKARLS